MTGCLLLAPTSVWNELGGFDLRFFMYGEDADLALRAAALGYRPAITPDAVITHEIGVSSESRPDKMVLVYRSKAALLRKHWPTAEAPTRARAPLDRRGRARPRRARGQQRRRRRDLARRLGGATELAQGISATARRAALGRDGCNARELTDHG